MGRRCRAGDSRGPVNGSDPHGRGDVDEATSDATLIGRTLEGEREAFDVLTRRYLRQALATAWEFTESLADAEDIVQEAFFRALSALEGFDPGRAFAPWFFSILRNIGRNESARRGRWESVPVAEELLGQGESPESELELEEIRTVLAHGLESLPAMQRACFRLRDIEGFTSREISDMLGVNDATVRVHVHRARQSLRQVLRPIWDERAVP